WKVRDVVVDGVSLVMNYRAQFARVLAVYPFAGLVARMQAESPAEPPPAASAPVPSAPSAPSTPAAAGSASLPPSVVREVPADRPAKPKAAKPTQPEQQIPKSRNGGK